MDSVARIHVAWELRQAGHPVEYIAERVGKSQATVFRWFRGIRQRGIRGFVRQYRNAKKGHRHRRTHSYGEQRVLAIRQEHYDCCGEKIVYGLAKEGIQLRRSTVYRVLNKHLQLRAKGRKNMSRGPLPQANRRREAVQMDTIDFGEVFAFTAVDTFTREGLVVLRPGVTAKDGEAALTEFKAYLGHCETIQTDGGSEFEAEFAELVPTACDHHRVARPYKKNEQAFIERFNLTVRKECLGWGNFTPVQTPFLQREVEAWLHYYHFARPSMAFDPMRPPLALESHLTSESAEN